MIMVTSDFFFHYLQVFLIIYWISFKTVDKAIFPFVPNRRRSLECWTLDVPPRRSPGISADLLSASWRWPRGQAWQVSNVHGQWLVRPAYHGKNAPKNHKTNNNRPNSPSHTHYTLTSILINYLSVDFRGKRNMHSIIY